MSESGFPERARIRSRTESAREIIGNQEVVYLLASVMRQYKGMLEDDAIEEGQAWGRKVIIEGALKQLKILDSSLDGKNLSKVLDQGRTLKDGRHSGRVIFGSRARKSGRPVNHLIVEVARVDSGDFDEMEESMSLRRPPDQVMDLAPYSLVVSSRETRLTEDGYRFKNSVGLAIGLTKQGGVQRAQGVVFIGGTPHYSEPIEPRFEISNDNWPALEDNLLQVSAP